MKYTLPLILLMAGCTAQAPGSRAAAPEACGAADYAGLIGQDAASALAVPDPKRIYRTDEEITTDFVPNRLNIKLDDTDTIFAVTCG